MRHLSTVLRSGVHSGLLVMLLFTAGGCGLLFGTPPSAVNIQLRKKIQGLNTQIGTLQQQVTSQDEVIRGLRERTGNLQTLTADRLAKLWTTHGLKFGRLTGGWDKDPNVAGDEGIKVYIAPTDEEGQAIKMAGAFKVELFDLADTSEPLIGTWKFDVAAARKAWRGYLMDYNYVLECPWQDRVPKHAELTLKVEFLDELTQTPFHAQEVIKVNIPAATQPATRPWPQLRTR